MSAPAANDAKGSGLPGAGSSGLARPPREEQALREVGHTGFSRGVRGFLLIVFLAIVAAGPALQFLLPAEVHARLRGCAGADVDDARGPGTRIEARVAAVSAPPDSRAVYKDFLMRLHLTGVRGAGAPELVMAVMAMRDHMVQPVAAVMPGARVVARIRDWREVEKAMGGVNGSMLEDERFLQMPLYYGSAVTAEGVTATPDGADFLRVWAGQGGDLPTDARVPIGTGLARAWRSGGSFLGRLFAVNRHLARRIVLCENTLDDTAVPAVALRPRVQALLLAAGVGNEKAYVGRDGWLFFAPDVQSLTGPGFLEAGQLKRRARGGDAFAAPVQPDPCGAILRFHADLAARGIDLVLMPTPVKPSIHPEHLAPRMAGQAPMVRNRSFEAFLADMRRAGVRVYDPAPLLLRRKAEAPQYLATDTHWTPAAMMAVAAELAGILRPQLPAVPSPGWQAGSNTVSQPGDVATMLKLPGGQCRALAETVVVQTVHRQGQGWRPDEQADVLLLGDSFSNIYSMPGMGWGAQAGFAEHLAVGLDRNVDRLSRNDAGSHASRQLLVDALKRNPSRLDGKRVVVWQFAERELASGDWKELPLPPARPPLPPANVATTATPPDERPAAASPAEAKAAFAGLAKAAEADGRMAVAGRDDWLFLVSELRHLGGGPFWGEHAAAPDSDPLRAIVDLHGQLAAQGITLLVVPVPPRAVVYADKLLAGVPAGADGVPARLDVDLQAFYATLRTQGVNVVDVTDAFLAARRDDASWGPVCCEQDSHWSPRGLQIAAQAVRAAMGRVDGLAEAVAPTVQPPQALSYIGDLVANLPGHPATVSTTTVSRVTADAAGAQFLTFRPDSPVLLLSDSHGLVFSSGDDMHTMGAGFAEHLSAALGFPVDCMARRGSGSQVRIELARRFLRSPQDAAGKRFVVYMFAARTFTESDRWKPVPLSRPSTPPQGGAASAP